MTTSKSSRSDSKSHQNKGSRKIKSDVLSIESSGLSSDVAATTLVGGGPVVCLINKRLRNHRKKLNRILQMEEFLAQGKPLNKGQAQLLQSKPAVSALIDELENLRKPLASAVSEEISLALQRHANYAENSTCQDQDQEKGSEENELKADKGLPIDSKSDHVEGSSKYVMSTERSGPSEVDQQNEGIALPLRTELKQTDRKWKIHCKNYLEENSWLLHEKDVLELEFERLKLSSVLYEIRSSLLSRWPTINCNSNAGEKEEDSLIDQQNEEFSLSPWKAEVLGIPDIDKMEEVDWERCCRELRGSNMWLEEQLREYKGELDVMAELALEFPELNGGKPADTSPPWPY